MPFEARKTNFTVFSLNHELHNFIRSAFNMKLEPDINTNAYRCQKPRVSPSSDGSDAGLKLETSAFEPLYGGQFTLSTHQLIEPSYLAFPKIASQLDYGAIDYHGKRSMYEKYVLCNVYNFVRKWSQK